MVHFGEFSKTWSLRSNSVTRHVSFNRTKIGKCQNWKIQMRHFGWFSNTYRSYTNDLKDSPSVMKHYYKSNCYCVWAHTIISLQKNCHKTHFLKVKWKKPFLHKEKVNDELLNPSVMDEAPKIDPSAMLTFPKSYWYVAPQQFYTLFQISIFCPKILLSTSVQNLWHENSIVCTF